MNSSNWFGRINGTYFGEPLLYVDTRNASLYAHGLGRVFNTTIQS